ncbi:MAG: fibronectin type III domain-containing protein [Ignavibacteriaceae bacterium]|nr:fibronectin type III domain-containing protein [Ignavibacteriaceae bacterium]
MISSRYKYFRAVPVLFFLFLYLSGCSDQLSGPTDTLKPSVVLYSPVSNDTILYGQHEIIADMDDDQGIKFVDVYVNDIMISRFNTPENQYKPAVYLILDSTYIGKKISYYIMVYDLNNNGTKSDVKSNILVLDNVNPPLAPFGLDIRIITSNLINIFWSDTNRYEKGFEVWKKEGLTGTYFLWKTLGANTFNTNDASVSPTQTYFYKVRAFNDFGSSPYTYEVTSAGSGGSPNLPPPTNIVATALAVNIVYLTWQDNTSNETIFQIERKTGDQPYSIAGRVGPNTTSFKDSANGLTANTEYKYRLKVYSETDSSWSQDVPVKTFAQSLNTPTNLAAAQFDSVTVRLTWKDNSPFEIATFVERKIGDGGTYISLGQVGTDITSFDDQTYTPNVKNIYRVRSTDGQGSFSNYSAEASIIPTRLGGLSTPTNLIASQTDVGKIRLTWVDNSTTETFTVIEWRTAQSAYTEIKYVPANDVQYIHEGFTFDVQNFYRARAYDGVSFSNYSNEFVITPSSNFGLGIPTNVVLTNLTNPTRVQISWDDNSTSETATLIEWRIDTTPNFSEIAQAGPNLNGYIHLTPQPGINNHYRLRTTNGRGYSQYSLVVSITPTP